MAEYDIFLSHYSGDDALARSLERALTAAGISVWYDGADQARQFDPRQDARGRRASRYGLILFTPGFLSSTTGFRWGEVEAYLAEQLASGRTNLLPLVAGVDHGAFQDKMPLLRSRRYEQIALNKAGNASRPELTALFKLSLM